MSTSNLVGVYGVIWGCVQISHVISVISISHGHKGSTIFVQFWELVGVEREDFGCFWCITWFQVVRKFPILGPFYRHLCGIRNLRDFCMILKLNCVWAQYFEIWRFFWGRFVRWIGFVTFVCEVAEWWFSHSMVCGIWLNISANGFWSCW